MELTSGIKGLKNKLQDKFKKVKESDNTAFHLMIFIPVMVLIVFNYIPMLGTVMAFQDYQPGLGFLNSKWVGLENFRTLFALPGVMSAFRNTLFIAVGKIIGNLVVPIVFALLLNEVRIQWFKRSVQTITYLPYFLSWVILSGILLDFLSPGSSADSAGLMNTFLHNFGIDRIMFLGDKNWFPFTIIASDIWKNFGFNTIVYLAALTGVDPALYEASAIDGAGRWRQTLHITLPGIKMFVVLMTVLSIGNVLNAGFDQIFNLYSPMVYETGDIIDTMVYRIGLIDQRYSLSTAVGLLKSVISMILISVSYKLADKYAGYQVF